MVNVINSCHHPAAALSLAGPQRFSSMVLLSLIKASKCEGINTLTLWSAGNKHQQCCSLRLWEIQAAFSSSVCWKSIPNEEGRWKINENILSILAKCHKGLSHLHCQLTWLRVNPHVFSFHH